MNSIAIKKEAAQQAHEALLADVRAAASVLSRALESAQNVYGADFKAAVAIETDPTKTEEIAAWMVTLTGQLKHIRALEAAGGALAQRIYALKSGN